MYHSLLLLGLIGLGSLTEGQRYVYTLINTSMTWSEAKKFCSDNYKDLATVDNKTDVTSICPKTNGCQDAWVRVNYSEYQQNDKEWHWINGQNYCADEAEWMPGSGDSGGNCVYVSKKQGTWSWSTKSCCSDVARAVCYSPNESSNYSSNDKEVTWVEAVNFCKSQNKTLVSRHEQVLSQEVLLTAVQSSMNSMMSFINKMGSALNWWIGLYRAPRGCPVESSLDKNILCDSQNYTCAKIGANNQLEHDNCIEKHPFICYDHMVLVKENKTWEQALLYCRRNYCDLAVMMNTNEQEEVIKKAKMADTDFVWVGLHYVGFFEEWVWVNGKWVSISDDIWKNKNEFNDCSVSGAIQRRGDKLVKEKSDRQYNFICSLNC